MQHKYNIGDVVHTYIGWGIIVKLLPCSWYIIEFDSGMTSQFPENQLTTD